MQVIERNLEHADHASEHISERRLPSPAPQTIERDRLALRLAAFAGFAAALASMAGFIPGMYRDPKMIVDQSHGYDVANLVVVLILELGLLWASRGAVRVVAEMPVRRPSPCTARTVRRTR